MKTVSIRHQNGGAGDRSRLRTSTKQQDWFLSAQDFARALVLERRRVERSRKLLLLMLLDAGKALAGDKGRNVLGEILAALSTATRETDMRGWHVHGSVIGIVFTEIPESDKSAVKDAVLRRIRTGLQTALGSACTQSIAVSTTFFPEDWSAGPSGNGGTTEHRIFQSAEDRRSAQVLKRSIDIAGSSLALAVLAPIFALVAVLVKLTSNGPVLFRQKRVGKHGRPFQCLKFRSMHVTNDANIHKEYVRRLILGAGNGDARPGTIYKLRDDPRITPVGRVLRKASLDELPQFWNVLKGEMSLVGPRPAIPYELESYDVWHRRRVLGVKPGITGLWQVQGRSRTTFDEMVRLDLRYAKSWSVWLDLKILLKTPGAVFSGEGAY